jgi:hypothetical protein
VTARAAVTGGLHVSPSVERLTKSSETAGETASEAISHTPWTASYATTGSLTRAARPGGEEKIVRPGRKPLVHVRPPSVEVAKPMLDAPPSK